jgi:uncharacterized protein with FMN-binding domain
MRRIVIAIASTLTGLVLLFSWPTSLNRSVTLASGAGTAGSGTSESTDGTSDGTTDDDTDSASDSSSTSSSGSGSTTDSGTTAGSSGTTSGTSGTFVGDAVTTRYGDVQVQITVTDGVITSAEAISYPYRDGRSQQINDYAIPILQEETQKGNSGTIAMVSGATVTSTGYIQSLQSAIDQAGL